MQRNIPMSYCRMTSYTKHGYTIVLGGIGAKTSDLAKNIEKYAANMGIAVPADLKNARGQWNTKVADELANKMKKKAIDKRKDWEGRILDDELLLAMQNAKGAAGWTVLGRKKSPAQQAARTAQHKAHPTNHIIGMPVYGVGAYDMEAAIAEAAEAKTQWKFNCVSFELWAAMTGYDDSLPDGGPAFQKMCHYLLVDGRTSRNFVFKKRYFDDENGGMTGEHWGQIDPEEDTYWDARAKGGKGYAYIGKGAKAWEDEKGGPIGYNSQGEGSVGGAGFSGQGKQGIEMPVTVRPGSKSNWMRALGISLGPPGVVAVHGTQASQFTRGTQGQTREIDGVSMAKGNRLAALIGLYFYANCRHAELNWTKGGTVEDVTYHIRMRLPNPNYTRSNSTLRVKEDNNDSSRQALGTRSTVLGGSDGFPIDHVFKYRKVPLAHINLFLFPHERNLVTIVAPFFGDAQNGFTSTKADIDRTYIRNLITHNKEIAHMLHTPEDNSGFVFGWKMSKALWLYPHVSLEDWNDVTLDKAKLPGWQPTPEWRQTLQDGMWRRNNLSGKSVGFLFQEYQDFGSLLEKRADYEPDEIRKLRRYALGLRQQPEVANPQQMQVNLDTQARDQEQQRDDTDDEEDEVQGETPRQVDQDPDVQRDTDDVTGTAGQAEIMQQDQSAVMDFGNKAIAVQSLVQNLSFAGELKESGLAADIAAEYNEVKKHNASLPLNQRVKARKVAVGGVFPDNALEPGAPKTARDINEHFTSVDAQPWPHTDIYEPALHKFKTRPMGEAGEKRYADKYGDVSNLYIRSTQATEITGVEVNFGKTKAGLTKASILDELITVDNPVFRRNLRRILLIYYNNQKIGFTDKHGGNEISISADEKKKGMREGIYRYSKQTAQSYTFPRSGKRNDAGSNGYLKTLAGQLWKPVFTEEPPREWAECFDFNLHQGFDKDLVSCMDRAEYDLSRIKSNMTVLDWITSPWHYAYLPYQPQKALFRDGETYSEGCRRCSRPFYEYNEEYSAYKYSVKGTEHWPGSFWQYDDRQCEKGRGNVDGKAPQPFHDKIFWNEEQVKPKFAATLQEVQVGTRGTPPLEEIDRDDGSWHNWPTHEFQMPKCERGYRGLDSTNPRGKPLQRLYKALKDNGEPATFRKYYNHVFDDARQPHQQREITQGKLTFKTAKIKYGQTEYKLRRVSKYCNVCMDCAAVLETASGLFLRNHRVVKPFSVVQGNDRQVATGMDWWTNVLNKSGNPDFDPAMLHKQGPASRLSEDEQQEHMRTWEATLDGISKYLKETQHSLPGSRTKFRNPPEINIQNALDHRKNKKNKEDAIATLQKLVNAGDSQRAALGGAAPARQAIDAKEFENPAFRDMVADLARKYSREASFVKDDNTDVFDSNMFRKEYRNESWLINGEVYDSCLRVRQWKPRVGIRQEPQMQDYETVIYLATRYGSKGEVDSGGSIKIDSKSPTERPNDTYPILAEGTVNGRSVKYRAERIADKSQWGGDGFVTTWNTNMDGGQAWEVVDPLPVDLVQTRHLRQSRLFITYSLHRPVTSEMEARLVMERMANAAHLVFGDDRYLSQILVFGQKLVNFKRDSNQPPDSLSAAHFGLIDKPRKKEALTTFYATGNGSSYVFDTYETHVDKVEVDGGIEIGPQMHHPHFHILITITHYTYVQIDYFKMNQYFELLFRGHDPMMTFPDNYVANNFKLVDGSGGPFYTDNEHPYVDIRLYPQDNWQEVLAAYVRKQSRSMLGAANIRAGSTKPGNRPNDYNRPAT